MTAINEKVHLLKDALALLKDYPKFSNMDEESLVQLYEDKQLKVSVRLKQAIGHEDSQLDEYDEFYESREFIEEGRIDFPPIIIADPLDGEIYSALFYCDVSKFKYKNKIYCLDSCLSQQPVITETELKKFISVKESKPKEKRRNSSAKKVKYNNQWIAPKTAEKYKKWQEAVDEKHESNPSMSHTQICMIIAKYYNIPSATMQRNTKIKH